MTTSVKDGTAVSKGVPAFDVINATYIFFLVIEHIYMQCGGPTPQVANLLPYPVIDNGQVYMPSLLLISGWLSHASFNAHMTHENFVRKKLVRLLPGYLFGGLPMTLLGLLALSARNPASPREDAGLVPRLASRGPFAATFDPGSQCGWFSGRYDLWPQHVIQFILEIFTIGAWNPVLGRWSANTALWFAACLLMYHYVSPVYIKWLRKRTETRTVAAVFLGLFLACYASHAFTLLALYRLFDNPESFALVTHLWAAMQIWCPFIGCTLHNLSTSLGMLSWRPLHVRIATDATVMFAVCGSIFSPRPSAYGNLLTMPAQVLATYLLAHNQSTLDRVYHAWPALWTELLQLSYPLYLMHWPICLGIGVSGAVDMASSSGVAVALLACVAASSLVNKTFVAAGEALLLRAMQKSAQAPGAGQADAPAPDPASSWGRRATWGSCDAQVSGPGEDLSWARPTSFESVPEAVAHIGRLELQIQEQQGHLADLCTELRLEKVRGHRALDTASFVHKGRSI